MSDKKKFDFSASNIWSLTEEEMAAAGWTAVTPRLHRFEVPCSRVHKLAFCPLQKYNEVR